MAIDGGVVDADGGDGGVVSYGPAQLRFQVSFPVRCCIRLLYQVSGRGRSLSSNGKYSSVISLTRSSDAAASCPLIDIFLSR